VWLVKFRTRLQELDNEMTLNFKPAETVATVAEPATVDIPVEQQPISNIE
jgi:hypothetical protein